MIEKAVTIVPEAEIACAVETRSQKVQHEKVTVNSLFVATASITIVCSRIDDDDGKVGVRL